MCFMAKLASQMPSQVTLLMFVKSLWLSYHISNHLWALELPVTAGEIQKSSFYFSREFGNQPCCVWAPGFSTGLGVQQGYAALISFSPWSSCMLRHFQNFKDCLRSFQAQEVSLAKFRLNLFTDFSQDSPTIAVTLYFWTEAMQDSVILWDFQIFEIWLAFCFSLSMQAWS